MYPFSVGDRPFSIWWYDTALLKTLRQEDSREFQIGIYTMHSYRFGDRRLIIFWSNFISLVEEKKSPILYEYIVKNSKLEWEATEFMIEMISFHSSGHNLPNDAHFLSV